MAREVAAAGSFVRAGRQVLHALIGASDRFNQEFLLVCCDAGSAEVSGLDALSGCKNVENLLLCISYAAIRTSFCASDGDVEQTKNICSV